MLIKQLKIFLLFVTGAVAMMSFAATEQSLPDLVQAGKRDVALELIRVGENVNAQQPDGTTALHWAVYNFDEELTRALLNKEANPNIKNSFGSFPLEEAVKTANVSLTKMLLNAGADPNLSNQDKQTALMIAARIGNLEIVQMLVKRGADVNAVETWRGQSALMWAAARNHPDIAKYLIDHGADVNLHADAFDWGSQITSEPRAQYRPTGGLTPLLYAARGGCLDCVKAILKTGADINLPDPDGVTALMVAIDNFNYDVAKYLLSQGANPHVWDWWGRTALYIAVDMASYNGRGEANKAPSQEESLDMIRTLLKAGVDPDPQLNMHRPGRGGGNGRFTDDLLNTGATPLLRAANTFDTESVKLLLEYGADIELPNAMGVTPLLAASGFGSARGVLQGNFGPGAEKHSLATVKVLIAAGANIHARVQDTTSYTARIARRSTMSEREGQSVLHAAAKQGWVSVFQYLMDQGADIYVVDNLGQTFMDCAMGEGGGRERRPYESMVAYLKTIGLDKRKQ